MRAFILACVWSAAISFVLLTAFWLWRVYLLAALCAVTAHSMKDNSVHIHRTPQDNYTVLDNHGNIRYGNLTRAQAREMLRESYRS